MAVTRKLDLIVSFEATVHAGDAQTVIDQYQLQLLARTTGTERGWAGCAFYHFNFVCVYFDLRHN